MEVTEKKSLKSWVDEKGITQVFISKQTGLSTASVSRIIKAPMNYKLVYVVRIADSIGVEFNEIKF